MDHKVREGVSRNHSRDAPGKEGSKGECRVKGRVRVRAHGGVDLATTAKAVEGVEEPRAHEADKPEKDNLASGVVVQTLEAGRSLVEHRAGLVAADAAARGCVLLGVVGQRHVYLGRRREGGRGGWRRSRDGGAGQ